MLYAQTDERIFVIFELLRKNVTIEAIHEATKMDYFFLASFSTIMRNGKESC